MNEGSSRATDSSAPHGDRGSGQRCLPRTQFERGRTQEQAGSVSINEGVTHIAYRGPTLPVAQALNNATPYVAAIWFFGRFDQASPWKLWSSVLPDDLQGFTDVTFGKAYFTISNLQFDWNYAEGTFPVDTVTGVDLVVDSNSIVYPGPTQAVEDALSAVAVGTTLGQQLTVDVIWRFEPARNPEQPWSFWSAAVPPALRDFDQLISGSAYFITASTPGTLSFIAPAPLAAQELAIIENYASTTFFPNRFVVLKDQPVRIYFSRLHREHVDQFTISPFLSRSDVILPGQVAVIDFLPDCSGLFEIRNRGHGFGAPLVVASTEAEVIAERTASNAQRFSLIHRLVDETIFPERNIVQVGIPVTVHNLGVDANFRISIEPFYTPATDNVAVQEVTSFTFTPDQTGTFVIRDELNGLEAILVVE